MLSVYESLYDTAGLLIKVNSLDKNNKPTMLSEYVYDDQQRLARKKRNTEETYVYEYLGDPVTVMNVYTEIRSKRKKGETYYFNNKLQIIKIEKTGIAVDMNTRNMKAEGFYDKDPGKSIFEMSYNPDGTLLQKTSYLSNGNVTLRRHYYTKK